MIFEAKGIYFVCDIKVLGITLKFWDFSYRKTPYLKSRTTDKSNFLILNFRFIRGTLQCFLRYFRGTGTNRHRPLNWRRSKQVGAGPVPVGPGTAERPQATLLYCVSIFLMFFNPLNFAFMTRISRIDLVFLNFFSPFSCTRYTGTIYGKTSVGLGPARAFRVEQISDCTALRPTGPKHPGPFSDRSQSSPHHLGPSREQPGPRSARDQH